MQGNILVTQHVVRLVLLQTRDSLYQQLAMLTQMPLGGVGGLAGEQTNEAAETIAIELLDGLQSLPVECVSNISISGAKLGQKILIRQVATNGPSLVQKGIARTKAGIRICRANFVVRFVAIQLMESSVSPTPSAVRA